MLDVSYKNYEDILFFYLIYEYTNMTPISKFIFFLNAKTEKILFLSHRAAEVITRWRPTIQRRVENPLG